MGQTCNGVSSSSTTWNAGTQISQSTTYTIYLSGIYTNTLDIYVYFQDGTGQYNYDSNYDGQSITTRDYWSLKGWMGPYTHEKVSAGYAELGDAGPSGTYGYITDYEAVFTNVPSTTVAIGVDYYDGSSWSSTYYWSCKPPDPTITAQPSITNMSPTSGQSTTIQWSAATVSNQGSSTIYYQYFVGPSSTYSDSYHVGTTTSLSATITEANILAKCGSSFDGTCYVFVRAYWDNGSTQGGWSTPTGKAFTYTPHRTVKYYNGSSWVECIVYYYNGSSWIECVPYYYNNGWVECSH